MNHSLLFPIILQLVGVLIIMAEILIPSGGILGILAATVLGYSLFSVFSNISSAVGFGFVLADAILLPILVVTGFKFLAKSPVTLKKNLSSRDGVSVQKNKLKQFIGQQGLTLTDLRPSGIAMINKERLDVVTEGKYLAKGTSIVVISVTGNQIIVKEE